MAESTPYGDPVGVTDQRSQIKTFNIAPSWTRLLNNTSVFTLGAFVRRDQFNYYPSGDPFADLGPADLQRESVGQNRTLTNAGLRADYSYVKGIHNLKIGATYMQTFLDENDSLGIVDPTLNPICINGAGGPIINPSITSTSQCAGVGAAPNPALDPNLVPFDLTHTGSTLFNFNGHTDVKELALYRSGHHHQRKLEPEPGSARRFLQRADHTQGGRAAARRCLQHQAD